MSKHSIHNNVTRASGRRLVYVAPGEVEVVDHTVDECGMNAVCLQAIYSGISRGTEALVSAGKVPQSEWQTMRCPHQIGNFPFPVSYGYSMVGRVLEVGGGVTGLKPGDMVFVLHPHVSRFVVPADAAVQLPQSLPPRRAVLSANAETAVNAIWDSGLCGNEKVAVVGAGVVGLLTAFLARQAGCKQVAVVDPDERRKAVCDKLGLSFLPSASLAGDDREIVFHTSSTEEGLQAAIEMCALEGRVIEMSWYGDRPVTVSLGGAFHSRRLQLVSSQVGLVSPSRRNSVSHRERLQTAMTKLCDPVIDCLLEPDLELSDLPKHLPEILAAGSGTLCQVVTYREHGE